MCDISLLDCLNALLLLMDSVLRGAICPKAYLYRWSQRASAYTLPSIKYCTRSGNLASMPRTAATCFEDEWLCCVVCVSCFSMELVRRGPRSIEVCYVEDICCIDWPFLFSSSSSWRWDCYARTPLCSSKFFPFSLKPSLTLLNRSLSGVLSLWDEVILFDTRPPSCRFASQIGWNLGWDVIEWSFRLSFFSESSPAVLSNENSWTSPA